MPADPSVSPADTPDYEAIRLRAQAQLSHFGTGTGTGVPSCDRCGKPTNRWDEPCDYMQTAAALLAEDVRALLAVGERREQHIERLTEALETLLRFARPVDIEAALVQAGVDVRAVLADKEDARPERITLREAQELIALTNGGDHVIIGDAVPQDVWDDLHERGLVSTQSFFPGDDAETYTTGAGIEFVVAAVRAAGEVDT